MPPIDADAVLRTEANEIQHAKAKAGGVPVAPIGAEIGGAALYRALHERNASALCLSGGGIRSATFALGVIQALAAHPPPRPDGKDNEKVGTPKTSLLA